MALQWSLEKISGSNRFRFATPADQAWGTPTAVQSTIAQDVIPRYQVTKVEIPRAEPRAPVVANNS